MREHADQRRIRSLIEFLGRNARSACDVFFTGGACAVLHGWRAATLDVDLLFVPDSDDILRLLPRAKEKLILNIELVAPPNFIPELPGWRERCIFIEKRGEVSFYHYDFYSQALSKIERNHAQDAIDVESMLNAQLVTPEKLLTLFDEIEPLLFRYPAIHPESFRRAVLNTVQRLG